MRLNRSCVAALLCLSSRRGFAAENNPVRHAPAASGDASVQRVIVKFRAGDSVALQIRAGRASLAKALSERFGADGEAQRARSRRSCRCCSSNPAPCSLRPLEQLRADPDVEYAEADLKPPCARRAQDPLFVNQWYLAEHRGFGDQSQPAHGISAPARRTS